MEITVRFSSILSASVGFNVNLGIKVQIRFGGDAPDVLTKKKPFVIASGFLIERTNYVEKLK